MNYHKRYKKLKKAMGWTNADVARITGHTEDSIRSMTQPKGDFPRGLRLAIEVFERLDNE
jgi:hypothetical protein